MGSKANSMLTILRNHQNPARQKDPNVRAKCKDALDIYKGLGWQEKEGFLAQFGKSGFRNLGWVREYTQSVEVADKTELSCTEGYMTVGQVLQLLGYGLNDFQTKR